MRMNFSKGVAILKIVDVEATNQRFYDEAKTGI